MKATENIDVLLKNVKKYIHHAMCTMMYLQNDLEEADLFLKTLEQEIEMDKQINKVKKDLDKGEKDVKKLKEMDKVFDRKLAKAGIIGKKKKK